MEVDRPSERRARTPFAIVAATEPAADQLALNLDFARLTGASRSSNRHGVPSEFGGRQRAAAEALGERKGELVNMEPDGRGRVRLEYRIPARGLIGFTNEFLNLTRGSGLISNIFDSYEPHKGDIGGRKNGVLISMDDGEIFTYALGKLDDRGRMFVKANDPVYEGMIVGIHSRDNDLVVNATRTKQLTNFRVSGKEDAIKITPPIELTLEYGVEFIEDDELVEITPKSVRLRKRHLKEQDRKRASRA